MQSEKKYEITETQKNQIVTALSEAPHKFVGGVISFLVSLVEAKVEQAIEKSHE